MRNYDVTLIFSPLLEEQQANDILQQLLSLVQEQGGILGDQQFKGKRPLLSPIKKHKEGYLTAISFTLSPDHLETFEKFCKEQKDILRFLIAKQAKKRMKSQPSLARKNPPMASSTPDMPETGGATVTKSSSAQKEKHDQSGEEKTDLKDIDEKLEEIFKEA
jgi:ribosomal protein S6